jgi:pimeloyl-ACP methyl ester carboxylesterase
MIDRGHGTPLVLIPGLQGRWEWMRPAVDALSRTLRVISFSLCDERTSPFPFDPENGFNNYVSQVGLALDRAGIERAVIAGVSYGGLIATEFAARHPDRVMGLVLASALHASWEPDDIQRRYLHAPTLMSPLFVATAPTRMRPEVVAALPSLSERLRFAATHGARVVTAPTSPSRMARRIAWAKAHAFADAGRIAAPALIVTGEAGLDKIVPVDVTRRYMKDLKTAEHVVIANTGHIGLVTRPDAFAGVLERFVNAVRLSA